MSISFGFLGLAGDDLVGTARAACTFDDHAAGGLAGSWRGWLRSLCAGAVRQDQQRR
jgi:hypothetical protein